MIKTAAEVFVDSLKPTRDVGKTLFGDLTKHAESSPQHRRQHGVAGYGLTGGVLGGLTGGAAAAAAGLLAGPVLLRKGLLDNAAARVLKNGGLAGMVIGGSAGAGAGALGGSLLEENTIRQRQLRNMGVNPRGFLGGRTEFTPEAENKYLHNNRQAALLAELSSEKTAGFFGNLAERLAGKGGSDIAARGAASELRRFGPAKETIGLASKGPLGPTGAEIADRMRQARGGSMGGRERSLVGQLEIGAEKRQANIRSAAGRGEMSPIVDSRAPATAGGFARTSGSKVINSSGGQSYGFQR